MSEHSIFLPVLVQVFITLILYVKLSGAKNKAIKYKEVDEHRRSLHADAWPEYVQKLNNSIANQFELPVLFYVLVFVFWSLGNVSILIHVLSWFFILTRLVHAIIHTGRNYVPHRKKLFVAGVLILIAMTAICFIQIGFISK